MTLACDLDDEQSVSTLVSTVLETVRNTPDMFFEVTTNYPFELAIEHGGANEFYVSALHQGSEIGEADPAGILDHRSLIVSEAVEGCPKGLIAHHILSVISGLEGGYMEQESVHGYDLIIFYIREGYVPIRRKGGVKKLKNELVTYLKNEISLGEKNRFDSPVTHLVRNPRVARKWWEELKELSGYKPSTSLIAAESEFV